MAGNAGPIVWADEDGSDRIHVASGTRWSVEKVQGRLQWTLAVGDALAVYARALVGPRWVWEVFRGKERVSSGNVASEAEAIEAAIHAARRHSQ